MTEATILSSKIQFNAFKPRKPPKVEWLAHIATIISEANGWSTHEANGSLDGSWHGEGYDRSLNVARYLAWMAGKQVDLGATTKEEAFAAFRATKGQPALWIATCLEYWMLTSETTDSELLDLIKEVGDLGSDEMLNSP